MRDWTKELLKLHREHIRKLKLSQKYISEVYGDRGWERPNLGLNYMFEEDIRDINKEIKKIKDDEKKRKKEINEIHERTTNNNRK